MPEEYFVCKNCNKKVDFEAIGTKNRNHCPFCLWSLHVDKNRPGDRKSTCMGLMRPMRLIFKDEGIDKYGKKRQGEIVIIHKCQICGEETKNRITGDDDPKKVIKVFDKSFLNDFRPEVKLEGIELAKQGDKKEVERQLFGE